MTLSRAHALMWFALVVLSLVWGVLSGIALVTSWWLGPAAAVFGILACLVLAATLLALQRSSDVSVSKGESR